MSSYIRFSTGTDDSILVEVDEADVAPPAGVEKAGLRELARGKADVVGTAETQLSVAVESGISHAAQALEDAVSHLTPAPSEIEMVFGLKATGEVGNIAIAKACAEANFEVRLKWVRPDPGPGPAS